MPLTKKSFKSFSPNAAKPEKKEVKENSGSVEMNSVGHFKQFVVTNCSKERPGSIVNETLKKRNFDTKRSNSSW